MLLFSWKQHDSRTCTPNLNTVNLKISFPSNFISEWGENAIGSRILTASFLEICWLNLCSESKQWKVQIRAPLLFSILTKLEITLLSGWVLSMDNFTFRYLKQWYVLICAHLYSPRHKITPTGKIYLFLRLLNYSLVPWHENSLNDTQVIFHSHILLLVLFIFL